MCKKLLLSLSIVFLSYLGLSAGESCCQEPRPDTECTMKAEDCAKCPEAESCDHMKKASEASCCAEVEASKPASCEMMSDSKECSENKAEAKGACCDMESGKCSKE